MVVSEPEGAEIFVDGKNSNILTPGLVPLPLDFEMSLTLKKPGYEEIRVWVKSKHRLSFHYSQLSRTQLKLIDQLHDEI